MADFTRDTNFNENAGIASVRYGSDAPILEVELNEMQQIQIKKLQDLIRLSFGDGISGSGPIQYVGGVFTIADRYAVVAGTIIPISSLSLSAANGDTIYLSVWNKVVTHADTLKKDGNEQETTESNPIKDNRLNIETTRRVVTAFTLTKTNLDPNCSYLKLGKIEDGQFVTEFAVVVFPVDIEGLTQHGNDYHTTDYEPAFIKGTAFNKNFGATEDTIPRGNDARFDRLKGGSSTFAGNGEEKTIAHGCGAIPLSVSVTPLTDSGGTTGEIWVRRDATNIYVGNTGSSVAAFTWLAIKA